MANNVNPREPEKKPGIWRSFLTLMTSVKAPWGWVGAATLVSLFGAQLSLMIPDATAKVATGDISMGAILFAAGDKREILPHGEVMIHDPLIYGGVGGSALSVQETSRQLLKTRQTRGDILARHTGKSRQEIYRKTAKNTWFSAEEAVSFGLADRVINKL